MSGVLRGQATAGMHIFTTDRPFHIVICGSCFLPGAQYRRTELRPTARSDKRNELQRIGARRIHANRSSGVLNPGTGATFHIVGEKMSRYKSRSGVPGPEVDDAALGDEPDGWRSRKLHETVLWKRGFEALGM